MSSVDDTIGDLIYERVHTLQHEVDYRHPIWVLRSVARQKLKQAVKEVGPMADKVKAFLAKKPK